MKGDGVSFAECACVEEAIAQLITDEVSVNTNNNARESPCDSRPPREFIHLHSVPVLFVNRQRTQTTPTIERYCDKIILYPNQITDLIMPQIGYDLRQVEFSR